MLRVARLSPFIHMVAAAMVAAGAAWGQAPRLQFASPSTAPPPVATPAPAVVYPGGSPAAVPHYAASPPGAFAAPPAATFQGGIMPAPAISGFDPYQAQAAPLYGAPSPYYSAPMDPAFSRGPSALVPNPGPYPGGQYYYNTPEGGMESWYRFLQAVTLEYTWLEGSTDRALEMHEIDLSGTFAVPLFGNIECPLFITPGFALYLWEGPLGPTAMAAGADLPPRAYAGYLDVTWRPKVSEWFGAELAVRPGVYADFNFLNDESFRLQGRGVAFIRATPKFQFAFGAAYLDRLRVKLLPVVGVIWTPHEHARYEIVFPRPKASHYLFTSWTNTEWWWYVSGEYGGGSWTVRRESGTKDQIDINDIRVIVGLEFHPTQSLDGAPRPFGRNYQGFIEAGYVWERELLYRIEPPARFSLRDTVMLRGGFRF